MSRFPASPFSNPTSNTMLAIVIGMMLGTALVVLALREARFEGSGGAELAIHINGVEARQSRDVLLPTLGWVLQIELPPDLPAETRASLQVTLRAERTGAMIEITDQLEEKGGLATLVIPESLGLYPGLLSIRATLTDADEREIDAYRRVRIRSWLGGPPIGARQIIHFDFTADRDQDDRPDFVQDLEGLGLATPERPDLAKAVAERIATRAIARVARAYDAANDPNRTGLPRDSVLVRFLLEADASPFVTRICVGGRNQAHPESVGNVRFDHRNERRSSQECDAAKEGEPAAGIFPSELQIYSDSVLYREVLGPFSASGNGVPVGQHPQDEHALESTWEVRATPDQVEEAGVVNGTEVEILGGFLDVVLDYDGTTNVLPEPDHHTVVPVSDLTTVLLLSTEDGDEGIEDDNVRLEGEAPLLECGKGHSIPGV